MSSLKDTDKRYLEEIFNMGGGYVLDYTDATYGAFFGRHKIDIHGHKYRTYGTAKAKKMRAFWEQESDLVVGNVLTEMLQSYEAACDLNGRQVDRLVLDKARDVVERLTGRRQKSKPEQTIERFLQQEFTIPNIQKLPIEQALVPIVEKRLDEARKALGAGAYLSVVILCGSILEAVLLGNAQREPAKFNSSKASPRTTEDKVRPFHDWTLSNFIDVASELEVLKLDVKKFSYGLRDFRNYIHPYQQMASGFAPDEHTAKICFQVLKAALASVAGQR